MRLYIGNCSYQRQVFMYRAPGPSWAHVRQVPLEPGTQRALPDADLDPTQVESIVGQQHAHYGLISAEEANRAKGFHGLCYSIDKPITHDRIHALILSNQEELERRGRETREQAAVAANEKITSVMQANLREAGGPDALSMTISEVETPNAEAPAQVNEAYRITRQEGAEPPSPRNRRRRAA